VDRAGQAVGGITSNATKTHYKRQPWWPVVFEEGRPWGGTMSPDQAGRWYWEVAVPIKDIDNRIIGGLKVVIGQQSVLDPVLSGRIGRTGHLMLLDPHGAVVACSLRAPSLHSHLAALATAPSSAEPSLLTGPLWRDLDIDTHQNHGGIVGLAPVHLRPDITLQGQWTILDNRIPTKCTRPSCH